MANKNKFTVPSTVNGNELTNRPDTTKVTDVDFQKRLQELQALEDSLSQKEILLTQKENELKIATEAISKQKVELNTRQVQVEEMELQARNGFPKLFEERFSVLTEQLKQREVQCNNEYIALEVEKEKLRLRELAIHKAEIQRDNGYADERAKLDEELFNLHQTQVKELELKRTDALDTIDKELSEKRSDRLSRLEKELADRLNVHEASIQQDNHELEQKREILLKDKAKLDEQKDELEYQKQRLQSRKDALDEQIRNLDLEVEDKVTQRRLSFECEKASLTEENAKLRESIAISTALVSNFEALKLKLGNEDPAVVLLKLKTYEEEIKKLREDLATRPTQEMRATFDRLKSDLNELQLKYDQCTAENIERGSAARRISELEMQLVGLSDTNKSLQMQKEFVDADNNRLIAELKRLQASYEREQDREARIRDIESPYCSKERPRAVLPKEDKRAAFELEWLDSISQSCIDYGLRFPRRILHAYHTALKTSELSPITVLAGVSGTGKSELPRLYSHFGGINFLSLSVQPNWDSQESMLGFFNSIDNKFDAQPVLRLLAQSQKKKTEDYPLGLEDVVSLILMDEMNLAHVELYFAEFLSKFELRRGRKGNDVPCLEVKLGAGIQHYDLPLGRNVLWTGTMNQDETTKSLSDKVLDRGIVINFPRPTTLERRSKLMQLGEPAALLSRKLWESWWCKESKFNEEQILPFKGFVEEMNTSLSKVGRALGHRVWQSIEYYMANYPDVLAAQRTNDDSALVKAMKIAFEDQLVQKVMPKLRGIETRGKSKSDCLDRIRTQLVNNDYSIIDDFDLACEFGYGQFIWNSANYLKDSDLGSEQK